MKDVTSYCLPRIVFSQIQLREPWQMIHWDWNILVSTRTRFKRQVIYTHKSQWWARGYAQLLVLGSPSLSPLVTVTTCFRKVSFATVCSESKGFSQGMSLCLCPVFLDAPCANRHLTLYSNMLALEVLVFKLKTSDLSSKKLLQF